MFAFTWRDKNVVSVCSPKAYKDLQKLTNRPGIYYKLLIMSKCSEMMGAKSTLAVRVYATASAFLCIDVISSGEYHTSGGVVM